MLSNIQRNYIGSPVHSLKLAGCTKPVTGDERKINNTCMCYTVND